MISKDKSKAKDTRPNSGTASRLESIARSFKQKMRFQKSPESKAKAKNQLEGKNTEGSVYIDSHPPSPSAPPSDPSTHNKPTTIPNPQHADLLLTNVSGSQVIQNYGSHNRSHVGDDNRYNMGTIVRVTGGSAHFYPGGASFTSSFPPPVNPDSAPERSTSRSFELGYMKIAVIFIEATQQVLHDLFGNAITNSTPGSEKSGLGEKLMEDYFRLVESIKSVVERDNPDIRQELRDYLGDLWSGLLLTHGKSFTAEDQSVGVETLSRDITWKVRLFLFVIQMAGHISTTTLVEMVKKRIMEVQRNAASPPSTKDLPSARAAYDDYVSSNHTRVSCFEGTRQALLDDVAEWVAKSEIGIFVLFGLAGIGKSTVAQTIAERADNVRLLGASFFFSRNEPERRTAEKFFTTIAFQLCLHDIEYAEAIGKVIGTDQGRGATGKRPLEQLETLILEPLRDLARRTVVIVIDALDECDESDGQVILQGLNRLVKYLPSFKVILTTRPQPHLQLLIDGETSQIVFHLHDIEDEIVDGDIERYLRHKLSPEQVKVHLPKLRDPWAANDDEITLLVRGAGRLFIIASTAVLFVLDKTSTPASRMRILRTALDQGHTPLNKLNDFYTVILRSMVPKDCEPDTAKLYQTIIGTIILLQQPLPVSALAKLIDVEVNEIITVLSNLQSVILLGSNDIPIVYHKSFPDYIQDPERCKDQGLYIDPTFHHTRMAINCLRLLNRRLKQNIMDLGDPARFMENDQALRNQGLTDNHIQEKIPLELRYACSYFAHHIRSTDKDINLAEELEQFFYERFLNWLEALSWIGKLDSAHRILLMAQKQLKPISSDLPQLVSDGLRFIGKFYARMRLSALHIYHSALPFTPTETSLYMRYSKQMTFCRVQGGQKMWDGLVAKLYTKQIRPVSQVTFSPSGSMFSCCVDSDMLEDDRGRIILYDAVAGILLGRIEGWVLAIADDCSKAAVVEDGSITLYNMESITSVATIKTPATAVRLVLSSDGSRLVAGLDNGTIGLWDTKKCEWIKSFGRCKDGPVVFSSDGSRITFAPCDGVIQLLDGTSGEIITELQFPGLKVLESMFSGDGSRLVCLANDTLKIWDSRDGTLIGTAENVGDAMVISTSGSLIATGKEQKLKFWSGNNLALLKTLDLDFMIKSLTIQNDLLAIVSIDYVALYYIDSYTFITKLHFSRPTSLAFSPDCMRLAVGNETGEVMLWDIPSSINASDNEEPFALAVFRFDFSPDCSCLASGHGNGAIKLWDTSNMTQIAAHKGHSECVWALAFSVDGRVFASGSKDRTIRLWNGKDGGPGDILECSGAVTAVAMLTSILAASTKTSISLWDLKTHSIIATYDQHDSHLLAFSHNHSFLAAASFSYIAGYQQSQCMLTLWDVAKHATIATFNLEDRVCSMCFLPDGSQLATHCGDDKFHLFNPYDSRESKVSESQAISQLGICPSWNGIPVWFHGCQVAGRFSQQETTVLVLELINGPSPVSALVMGSSLIALGCLDGCIYLIKPKQFSD